MASRWQQPVLRTIYGLVANATISDYQSCLTKSRESASATYSDLWS